MKIKLVVNLLVFLGIGYFTTDLYFEGFTEDPTNIENDNTFVSANNMKQEPKPTTPMLSFPDELPVYDGSVRSSEEWQGMEVSKFQPACGAKDGCGLAMACIDGKCLGCRDDNDCAENESCVLQHCLRSENVECFQLVDCGEEELCVLSGYSSGIRGNIYMKAFCRASNGGDKQIYDHEERLVFDKVRGPYEPPTLEFSTIAEGLVYEADR